MVGINFFLKMVDPNTFFISFETVISVLYANSSMILPVFAMFSVVMLIIGKLYYKLRRKFPVKVNCWFCNAYTSVPYNSTNSWYCPHCEQYNGFCPDGSYNRILTEQFSEKLNFGAWCSKSKQKSPNTNGLCRFCNINLELKVQQLAQFVPLNQANYDEEVQQYSDQLERVYRLCTRCQGVLNKTLTRKQELYINNQQQPFKSTLNQSKTQGEDKERLPIFLAMTATLSVCLLLTTIPHTWLDQLSTVYPQSDHMNQLIKSVLIAVPPYLFPLLGAGVQVLDSVYMKDTTSLVNLFLWVILILLPYAPVKVDGLVSVIQMLASIVFLITSLTESKHSKLKTSDAAKPVTFQKLDEHPKRPKSPKIPESQPTNPSTFVSDSIPSVPDLSLPHESTPEDFGFSKLNVSSRRITRSQTKPFQTKKYSSATQNDIFRSKPINLTPPKLHLDKSDEYQAPLTRCSSQSSGFVSLTHQKDLEEDRTPSFINENIESVSQCGGGILSPYRSPFPSPVPFSQYGPFSQFQPYAVMHFTPPPYNKVYSYANMSFYEPSLNLSSSSIASQRTFEYVSWFQSIKNTLSSLTFVFLITSNIAILWKVFGEEYFKVKT